MSTAGLPSTCGDFGAVDLTVEDGVAAIRLDGPAKANAITPEMLGDRDEILRAVDADDDVRVAIVSSAGGGVFCAGADIRRFTVLSGTQMWASWTRLGHQVFQRLEGLRQPTIAAIDGGAFGGGLELVLACDLQICSDTATLGLTEVTLGTVAGWGGTQRLTHLIDAARAKGRVLCGDAVTARTAHDCGLVNALASQSEVGEAALRWTRHIAGWPPLAVQMAKSGPVYPRYGGTEMTA